MSPPVNILHFAYGGIVETRTRLSRQTKVVMTNILRGFLDFARQVHLIQGSLSNDPAGPAFSSVGFRLPTHLSPTSPGPFKHVCKEFRSATRLLLCSSLSHFLRSSVTSVTSRSVNNFSPMCSTLAWGTKRRMSPSKVVVVVV